MPVNPCMHEREFLMIVSRCQLLYESQTMTLTSSFQELVNILDQIAALRR
eukprot:m.152076 g.152076  ORF g.152076 m.152076 type:complete len:50 (+) comp38585_c0_seq9:114-263(+)